jgi:branched-chain amino acid aminotransferase
MIDSYRAYLADFGAEVTRGHGTCWQSADGGHTGTYCTAEEARISIWDGGFNRGILVFDVVPMWQGWIRKLEAHISRFCRNLDACRINLETSGDKLKEQVIETARRSDFENAMIWMVATWGPDPILVRGSKQPGGPDHKAGLQIWVVPYRWNFPQKSVAEGIRVLISKIRAIPHQCIDARIKHLNRLHFFLAQLEVVDAGLDGFILLTLDGYISEGLGSNIWAVKKGKLLTPSECLQGITRECVFDLAREMKVDATTALLTPWDLYTSDEAFFSSSAGGIFPIVEIDSRIIGNGKPGSITKRLIEGYWKMHVDPRYCIQVHK